MRHISVVVSPKIRSYKFFEADKLLLAVTASSEKKAIQEFNDKFKQKGGEVMFKFLARLTEKVVYEQAEVSGENEEGAWNEYLDKLENGEIEVQEKDALEIEIKRKDSTK